MPLLSLTRRRVHPAWLAVAAVVILGLSVVVYSLDASRILVVDDLQEAQATAAELQQRLDQNAQQADLAVSILTSSDTKSIAMAGKEDATASTARAYWSPTRGLLIVADRLPAPPPERVYQVWIIEGGMPISAGQLGEQSKGRGLLIAPPPSGVVPGAVTVEVTDEPTGGLPVPTGSIRLVGSL